ncbi:MAG: 50S ribosomal protein L25 [Anaerolineales bacterium]|jgi:large subunit ribosomal protein L25
MEKVIIQATHRSVTGKQVHALRRAGQLPGVIYGHKVPPIPISMDARVVSRQLFKITGSSLVTVDLEGKEYPALVREKQRNYVKGNLIHVDFQVVSLTEKIRANIGIELTGTSQAVKDLNAVLVTVMTELEVECFPQDLPERVVVDISGLANIGDGIHVRDIVLSDKVQVLEDLNEMVVLAAAPKQEVEEVVAPEAEVAAEEAAEPEVIEKGKKEEEESEEAEKK